MEGANQLSEVHDYCWGFFGDFFFWIVFPQNELVEAWHLTICFFAVYCIIDDGFNFVLIIVSSLKFPFWL